MSSRSRVALVAAGLALAFSAGPRAQAAAPQDIVFPPPPDAPRVRYLKSVAGKPDLKGKGGSAAARLWRFLSGKEDEALALARPYGVWASGGRIYVADTEASSVVVFDQDRARVERIGAGAQERLVSPIGVAVDASSRVYVSDSAENVVKAYSPEFKLLWQAGKLGEAGELRKPAGIAVGRGGNIFVADSGNSRIVVLSEAGKFLRAFGRKGSGEGELSVPSNLWVERDGTVLVADTILCRVEAFSPGGEFLFQLGECGDMAGYLARPRGVASDSDGNVYVVDALFNSIQLFDRKGRLLMFFGGFGSGPAAFQLPAGIFIDEADRIYVTDSFNRRVQVFQYLKSK